MKIQALYTKDIGGFPVRCECFYDPEVVKEDPITGSEFVPMEYAKSGNQRIYDIEIQVAGGGNGFYICDPAYNNCKYSGVEYLKEGDSLYLIFPEHNLRAEYSIVEI